MLMVGGAGVLIGVDCIWIAFDSDLDDTYGAYYVGIRD